MANPKDIDLNSIDDFGYTIVLSDEFINAPVEDKAEAETPQNVDKKDDGREEIDRLYYEYEKMCLREPTILDRDDAYPHTYYWRLRDRYDPAKVDVLKEALKQGCKIAETEAYEKYTEEVSRRKFAPDSWD